MVNPDQLSVPGDGIPREELWRFSGIVWRETFPGSGRYEPAAATKIERPANWPQAFMVASMFSGFAGVVWAIAWALTR